MMKAMKSCMADPKNEVDGDLAADPFARCYIFGIQSFGVVQPKCHPPSSSHNSLDFDLGCGSCRKKLRENYTFNSIYFIYHRTYEHSLIGECSHVVAIITL